jgi:hypothetical protein
MTSFKSLVRLGPITLLAALLDVAVGCQTPESGATPGGDGSAGGTGGAPGSGGADPSGAAGAGPAGSTGAAGASSTGAAGTGAGGSSAGGGVPGTAGGRGGATGNRGGSGGNPSGGSGAAGAPAGALTLSALKIEANPNMTISCFVSWTTATAATSEVDFGEGSYQFRIRDAAAMVTAHRVLVIGMHAQTAYKVKAVSTNGQGSGSLEGTFTTGQLPASVVVPTLKAAEPAAVQPGWTITNIMPAKSGPALVVMYDQDGQPVWYATHGTTADARGDVIAKLVSTGVLIGPTNGESPREVDLSGKVIWTGPAQSNAKLMSHTVAKLSTGNYLLNIELDKTVTNGSTKIDDQQLQEIRPDLSVVWSWKLFDHIPAAGSREELCHGNTLYADEAAGFVYYNCRYQGLFKINKASGDIVWRLGGSYDTTSIGAGDFTYAPTSGRFSDAHDPEMHDDGTVLLYDNGGFSGVGASGTTYHSRVLEYQLDQTAKTAKVIWEFPGTFSVDAWYKNSWYSPYWGDADRLPNGNILITAAIKSASASSRILEVTRAGKVIWEITVPVNNGVYQADRVTPPLVEALP